jgi:hypothetical protein
MGISAEQDGLKYEDWVPITFSGSFTCDADALRHVCHPWDKNGNRVKDVKYLIVYESQLHRKLNHQNRQVLRMTNLQERWYGNILVVKFRQQSNQWRAVDVCPTDVMHINMQLLK